MARRNGLKTVKLQLTVDETTDRILGELVRLGILGTTKAEVVLGNTHLALVEPGSIAYERY